jgi:hypothetical protein
VQQKTQLRPPPGLGAGDFLHDPHRHNSQNAWDNQQYESQDSPSPQSDPWHSPNDYQNTQNKYGFNTPPVPLTKPVQHNFNYYFQAYPEMQMPYYQQPIQYAAIPLAFIPSYQAMPQPVYYNNQTPQYTSPQPSSSAPISKKKSPTKASQFKPSNSSASPDNENWVADVIKSFEESNNDFNILSTNLKDIAQTQSGSRFLQKQLTKGSPDFIEFVLKQIGSYLPELMTNDYGNYFCQRLLSSCSTTQRLFFINNIKGSIVKIAKDSKGIHTIQSIFDVITNEDEENLLAGDLKGHVFELSMVPNKVLIFG